MVELMNQRRKAIAEMKAKAKRDKPLTPAQQKEYMRAFNVYNKIRRAVDHATAKEHHQHLKWLGETLASSESKRLKRSHSTEQLAELQETTTVSIGVTIAAGDPISAIPFVLSVSAATSIPAETPIAACVSTTADAVPLRKYSRKKSMARRRTIPKPSQSKSAALPFNEDDPEAEFKKADGTVKIFSTLRELMYSVGRADLMVLYGMVSDKYKLERATAGDIMYMFVDKKYPILSATIQRMLNHGLEIDRNPSGNDLTTAIQLIQSLLGQLHPAP
nr:hypothetical protein [Tanacetum cinerariifolium]